MLWAIDVGNTHSVIGLHNGADWVASWRLSTPLIRTEDELAAQLKSLCDVANLDFSASAVAVASVVPAANEAFGRFAQKWFGRTAWFLVSGEQVGVKVTYDPPKAVGADRIANAVAAIELGLPPAIVVDFGTATTFDTIDGDGTYLGGAILPGVLVSLEGLVAHTAKLPQIALRAPQRAVGKTTIESLESGVMFGYAGAIDALSRRISAELGGDVTVVSTGGLGEAFANLCETISRHEPNLTLDGLRLAHQRA